ncbi:MAG: FlgD immunoglobulin-like domain containing protein [Fimbriimonas sp.]
MNRRYAKAAVMAVGIASSAMSFAQADWNDLCINYATPNWWSTDFAVQNVGNELFECTMGTAGTVRYDCFNPSVTLNTRGRIGFSVGPVGSAQTSLDNGMAITFGMPINPAGTWGYAMTTRAGNRTLFGSQAWITTFPGSSDRYFRGITVQDNIQVDLRVDVLADAARLQWTLTNTGTAAAGLGLWFGQSVSLLRQDGINNPAGRSGFGGTTLSYVSVPGEKPLRTERRFIRNLDPAGFPSQVDFHFNRAEGYGLQISNGPIPSTTDESNNSDATTASEVVIGRQLFLLGARNANDGNFPDVTFAAPGELISDVEFRDSTAYIQKFPEQVVAAGASRQIVAYYRSTWGDSSYTRPYNIAVDTPKVIGLDSADPANYSASNYLVRVYIDNTRGFSTIPGGLEMDLNDVKVTLTLPPGLVMDSGTNVRTITKIAPTTMQSVDFLVKPDGTQSGPLRYSVKVEPTPGDTKTVSGQILVATQPKLLIRNAANLVTTPWNFSPSTWDTILAPLLTDQDYQAFTWDPQQRGYVVQTGPERGKATWIISEQDLGLFPLAGSPTQPADMFPDALASDAGTPVVQLKSGWNLIGSPYSYPVQLGQLIGVSASNPTQSFSYQQLVNQGIINGSLAWWDEQTQSYQFIDRASSLIVPNRGYWIYITTAQDLTLRFPAVFAPWARSTDGASSWTQSEQQWRAQIVARTNNAIDDQNYIGQVKTASDAGKLSAVEPPMAPLKGAISVSVQSQDGKGTRLAQALTERTGRTEWKVMVETKEDGPVTLTWPNLATVPKNVRFRLVDPATGATRDMRKNSGYTFQGTARGIRELTVQTEPGVATRAVIGNVVVSAASKGPGASVTVNYTLSQDATTSVRVLSGAGREIYTMTRGRADRSGQNSVTWSLRDAANRAVAPGTYRVEITAESEGGDRVRRIVPVVVTR